MLSLPAGTEMFHFPALPPPALCVQAGVTGNYAQSGFPIRKSPDQCLVADFPGLIAGSNVLLRLLVPRHPPCALINLATTDDARVHCAVLKIRAVPDHYAVRRSGSGPSRVRADWRPFPQDPTACSARATPWPTFRPVLRGAALAAPHGRTCRPGQAPGPNNQCSTNERSPRDSRPGNDAGRVSPGKPG